MFNKLIFEPCNLIKEHRENLNFICVNKKCSKVLKQLCTDCIYQNNHQHENNHLNQYMLAKQFLNETQKVKFDHSEILYDKEDLSEQISDLIKEFRVLSGSLNEFAEKLELFLEIDKKQFYDDVFKDLKEQELQKILENGANQIKNIVDELQTIDGIKDCLKSDIIDNHESFQFIKEQILQPNQFKITDLLYKAKKHGFLPIDFHKKCDNKGPLLVLISTQNGDFGCLVTDNNVFKSSNMVVACQNENLEEQEKFPCIFDLKEKKKFKLAQNQLNQAYFDSKEEHLCLGYNTINFRPDFYINYSQVLQEIVQLQFSNYPNCYQIENYLVNGSFVIKDIEIYELIN
ncbi:hypothetical protein PPERSA_02414 [Pseudocohnilembus persalinus]|uniref:TLDc domain-containing protein n=1 Tax=Pseudocohnilembus persalinus TaxID=266149 RepID=A0A0V0QAP2_PSEPJ|nr:hypothetical protein PPERSA_02414 [Pseudocohnilembus persalinus]|eukprot:KRW99302.1 hypothetical protein PPERSA_02414 [Pseudocohnilembus persalinus]